MSSTEYNEVIERAARVRAGLEARNPPWLNWQDKSRKQNRGQEAQASTKVMNYQSGILGQGPSMAGSSKDTLAEAIMENAETEDQHDTEVEPPIELYHEPKEEVQRILNEQVASDHGFEPRAKTITAKEHLNRVGSAAAFFRDLAVTLNSAIGEEGEDQQMVSQGEGGASPTEECPDLAVKCDPDPYLDPHQAQSGNEYEGSEEPAKEGVSDQ